MKEIEIVLRSFDDARSFINTVSGFEGKVCVCSDMYEIDAKSVVGILSLNLQRSFVLKTEKWKDEYIPLLERFLYRK